MGNNPEVNKTLLSKSKILMDVLCMMLQLSVTNDKIIFHGSPKNLSAPPEALMVIEGVRIGENVLVLNSVIPQEVVKITMSKDPHKIQKYNSFNTTGVVEITPIRSRPMITYALSSEPGLYASGYLISRTFQLKINKQIELRTNLSWNPEIKLDNTEQTTLEIPPSKVVSDFRISVDGRGANGERGLAIRAIKVTN